MDQGNSTDKAIFSVDLNLKSFKVKNAKSIYEHIENLLTQQFQEDKVMLLGVKIKDLRKGLNIIEGLNEKCEISNQFNSLTSN